MRQLQIVVPDRRAKEFMDLLEGYGGRPLHMKATGPFDTIVASVEDGKVDVVVELLKNKGLCEEGSITILPPGITVSQEADVEEEGRKKDKIAPRIELLAMAKDMACMSRGFIYMTVLSSFVATLGLLLDSTAAVIGAMVIAPLLGPSISVCVGTVLGDARLFRNALLSLVIGLVIAILIAVVATSIAIYSGLTTPLLDIWAELPKEILDRTNLNVMNIGLALASGAAGAYSFAEGKGQTLMGVMIAVALVPPACVVGIGMAVMDPWVFLGAGLLLVVNVICINIAGTLVFWKIGVRPNRIFSEVDSKKLMKKRVATTAVILLVLSSSFIYSTYDTYATYRFKEDVQSETLDLAVGMENVTDAEVTSIYIIEGRVEVALTVFYNTGSPPPWSAAYIKEGLETRFGDGYAFRVRLTQHNMQDSG